MTRFITAMVFLFCSVISTSSFEIGDDGLHKQEWFEITFRDIAEDIETANEQGKRLALIFEQRGCIYCKEVHEKILSDEEVSSYLKENFMIVQYNIHGDEDVTDLDGKQYTEKEASSAWGLLFTPSIVFLPDTIASGKNTRQAAVAVMPGSFRKGTFLDFFKWVKEKGYEGDETFQAFHAKKIQERRAKRAEK